MSYKVNLNNTDLIFDSTLQEDSILMVDPDVQIEAGSAGSFTFAMPPTHKMYGQLKRATDYIDVYRDGEQDPLFSGRVYQIQDTMNGLQKVTCEGAMTFLSDTIFRPVTFDGQLHSLVSAIITSHNSQVESAKQITIGSITVANSGVYRDYLNYETSISRLKDLVETFGGYLMVRKRNGVLYLDWLDDFTTVCSQEIRLAENLIDIKKTINIDDLATVVIPLGAKGDDGERLTIKSVNSNLDYLTASSSEIAMYGYIVKAVIWDDVTTASALKTKGQNYLAAALTPMMNISLTAVDLADAGYDIESFKVGTKIAVTTLPHGLDGVQFSCAKQKLRLLDPGQNRMELGEVKEGYVQSQRGLSEEKIMGDVAKQISSMELTLVQAIQEATALITGNEGGYVIFHDGDGDGYPDEILIMNTADIQTATKVWRWNKSGLGYSSTGYNGTYGLAMTINGVINANYITTGTLTANLIRAGLLSAQNGESYWNLDTGELKIVGELGIEHTLNTVPNQPRVGYWITGRMKVGRARIPLSADNPKYRNELPTLLSEYLLKPSSSSGSYTKYAIRSQTCHGISSTWTDPTQNVEYTDYTLCKNKYARIVAVADMNYDIDSSNNPSSGMVLTERVQTGGFYYSAKEFDNDTDYYELSVSKARGIYAKYIGIYSEVLLQAKDGEFYYHGDANNTNKPSIDITVSAQLVNGTQIAFQGSSAKRYKKDIRPIETDELDPHNLLKLQIVEFKFRDDFDRLQYPDMKGKLIPGILAEDVDEIYPAAVIHDPDGNVESWDERRIIPGMLALIQEQQKEIEELKEKYNKLEAMVKELLGR